MKLLAIALIAVFLAACGGGGDAQEEDPGDRPMSCKEKPILCQ